MSKTDSLWDRVKGWWQHDAEHLAYRFIPNGSPAVASESYVRLWLAEMFLAEDRKRAIDRYPALQASIRLDFAGSTGATFATLTQPPPDKGLGPGVRRHEKLTELLPFSGGTVDIQASLLDVRGINHLGIALDIVKSFSTLLTPPLSSALAIADKVAGGIDAIDAAMEETHTRPLLVFQQTLASAGANLTNVVEPGHHVVLNAPASDYQNISLTIDNAGSVRAGGAEITGVDYFAIELEVRAERDDWRFPEWDALIGQAAAAQARGYTQQFEQLKGDVLGRILASPDLTPIDRKRVASLVRTELTEVLGAAGEESLVRVSEIVEKRGLPSRSSVEELSLVDLLV